MKLYELLKNEKISFPNHVILIKNGSFYLSFDDDAYILNYLLSYQINDNKVGFPISSLSKVIDKLCEYQINVYIKDEINKEYINNQYNNILIKARKEYFNSLNSQLLIDEITFLLKNNPENINKIRNFINEL